MGPLVVVVLALLACAPAANAAPKSMSGFVGGASPGTGGGGTFNQPRDVAVYEGLDGDPSTDKIFTVEAQGGNMRVQRLDVDGNFERMWGKDVVADGAANTGAEICTVAADCQAPSPSAAALGSSKGEFNNPMGVAVDQANGWVYVYDRTNFRVQKFDLDGNFLLMLGKGVNVTTGGDVCTQASGDACGIGAAGAGAGQLGSTTQQVRGLAVHPVTGSVFVSDPQNRRILQYQPDGTFLRGWGFGVDTGAAQFQVCTTASTCQAANAAGLANGQFSTNSPLGLAVDSQGVVYATDAASGTSAQRILRFDADVAPAEPGPPFPDASGALLGSINPTGAGGPLLATTTATHSLEIDADSDGPGPDEESLLALRDPNTPTTANTVVQELDIPTQAGELAADAVTVVDTHPFAAQTVNGIGVNGRTGYIYLGISLNGLGFPQCLTDFGPGSNCAGLIALNVASGTPEPVVGPPADSGADSAVLTGSIDPHGSVVSYRFEISDTGAADDWEAVGSLRYVSGTDSRGVSVVAEGLAPNTSYRARLVAFKYTSLSSKETVVSLESTFVTDATPPDAVTLGSAERTESSVQLRGTVDANGSSTTYRFEYGPAGDAFDRHIPIPNALAGSGNDPEPVSQTVTGLLPATAYHYRVVATNASGTDVGAPVTFTTRQVPAPQAGDARRGYELVSPPDKVGGVGVGSWYAGVGGTASAGFAAYDGERFASSGRLGSVLLGDSSFAFGNDWAFSERGPAGWEHHSPFTRAATGLQPLRTVDMSAASDDLSTVVWRSNGGLLRMFAEMETWTQAQVGDMSLLNDWEGRWEPTVTDPGQVRVAFAPGNSSYLDEPVISSDGSHAVLSGWYGGLAGDGDPSSPAWPDLLGGRATYVADLSAGLSNTFPGSAGWSNIGVCTAGTAIPDLLVSGKLDGQGCLPPASGRSGRLISDRGATISTGTSDPQQPPDSLTNVVSRNGARAFFTSPDLRAAGVPNGTSTFCSETSDVTLCPPQLYVRQRNQDGTVATRWISQAEDGLLGLQDARLTGHARFEFATPDGDKVFFRTNSPLTADDPNGAGGPAPDGGVTTGTASDQSWDLYMYNLPDGPDGNPSTPDADPAQGQLTRISAGPSGDGDCNAPLGGDGSVSSLRFAADDGSKAYFTCAAALPEVPLQQNGTITAPGGATTTADAANLYLYDATATTAQRWQFVARIPRALVNANTIAPCASTGQYRRNPITAVPNDLAAEFGLGSNPSRVGNCVRGTSDGSFITFWTDGRLTADDPDEVTGDVYAFDANADELTRMSAPQGGVGGSYPCAAADSAARCHGDGGSDTVDAPGRAAKPSLGVVTDPAVPGDRVAFFQSRSRLIAEDADDAYDVYQWRNGDLSLISTGVSDTDGAFYKGNSRDGKNVYFASRDRLTWQDPPGDVVLDVYSARVDGGIAQPPLPAVCGVLSGGCQGAGALAVEPAVGSTGGPGGDAARGVRPNLSVAAVGAKARRHAARRGVLSLRVRTSTAGRVTAKARARVRVRGRLAVRRVARTAVGARRAGRVVLRLRLSKAARTRLGAAGRLRVSVVVGMAGARQRTATVLLRRAGS
jgi:hypothetical protein